MPSVPAEATVPVAIRTSYPKRSISGTAMREIVAAVASEEPDIAPKPAHVPTLAMASDPRSPENREFTDSKSSRARLVLAATTPIRTNSGTTEKE